MLMPIFVFRSRKVAHEDADVESKQSDELKSSHISSVKQAIESAFTAPVENLPQFCCVDGFSWLNLSEDHRQKFSNREWFASFGACLLSGLLQVSAFKQLAAEHVTNEKITQFRAQVLAQLQPSLKFFHDISNGALNFQQAAEMFDRLHYHLKPFQVEAVDDATFLFHGANSMLLLVHQFMGSPVPVQSIRSHRSNLDLLVCYEHRSFSDWVLSLTVFPSAHAKTGDGLSPLSLISRKPSQPAHQESELMDVVVNHDQPRQSTAFIPPTQLPPPPSCIDLTAAFSDPPCAPSQSGLPFFPGVMVNLFPVGASSASHFSPTKVYLCAAFPEVIIGRAAVHDKPPLIDIQSSTGNADIPARSFVSRRQASLQFQQSGPAIKLVLDDGARKSMKVIHAQSETRLARASVTDAMLHDGDEVEFSNGDVKISAHLQIIASSANVGDDIDIGVMVDTQAATQCVFAQSFMETVGI